MASAPKHNLALWRERPRLALDPGEKDVDRVFDSARTRRQQRAAVRRAELDEEYVRRFAARVRELFPRCPSGREVLIAEHACRKYSGRVGRSAAAKSLDENAVRLAVIAHLRHAQTSYDALLDQGWERQDARAQVEEEVSAALAKWTGLE